MLQALHQRARVGLSALSRTQLGEEYKKEVTVSSEAKVSSFLSILRLKFIHLLLLGTRASTEFSAESSPDGMGSGVENPNAA